MADPLISVIICTYNRADLLSRTLESIAHQDLKKDHWQVVVVDNNSTDQTKEIVTQWRKEFSVSYVYEPQQGLSVARNTGAKAAACEYILYLDDDIYAEPGMLSAYYSYVNLHLTDPFACLAGKVVVEWEGGRPPAWFPAKFHNLYGQYDLGNQIIDSRIALGGNMLWNRSILLSLGGFDTNLGRKGNVKLASEETNLVQKALDHNLSIKYIPDAVVRHWTPYSRQTKSYLFKLCYWLGVSSSISENTSQPVNSPKTRFKKSLRLIREMMKCLFKFIQSIFLNMRPFEEPESVYYWGRFLLVLGHLRQDLLRNSNAP